MKIGKCSLALAALALAVVTSPVFAQSYKVSAKIVHDGTVVGEPTIVVSEGVPASVSVTGERGYKLELTVKSEGAGNALQVATQLDTHHGSVRSAVTAKPGEPAMVSSGGLDLTLTVTPGSS